MCVCASVSDVSWDLVAEEGTYSKKTWLGGLPLFFLGLVSSFGPGHGIGDEVARQGVDYIVGN